MNGLIPMYQDRTHRRSFYEYDNELQGSIKKEIFSELVEKIMELVITKSA
jgi:hypothetical protein